jgi:hypothetical protein
MSQFTARISAVMVVLALCAAGRAEVITVRSGNGDVGQLDSQVHMLVGPPDSAFPDAFTPADFAAADAGPAAPIIANHPAWAAQLAGDSLSKWIATNPSGASEGSTALYAINFVLTDPFTTATLDLNFFVDNVLGSGPNEGVYLNGTAISGDSTGGTYGGREEFSLSRDDVASLLVRGTNTLYIDQTDQGGPAGLLFRATITTSPEPTSLGLLGLGVLAILRRRRK